MSEKISLDSSEANDIGTFCQQPCGFCKFLDSRNIDTSGFTRAHLFCKFFPCLKDFHSFVFKILLRTTEQFPALCLQILPIYYDENRRATQLLLASQNQLACKEQHSISFPTPCGSEICTTLAITSDRTQMIQDMVSQFTCSKELRIATYDFSRVIFFCWIGKIDIVP